jgi:hypothetical protein
MYPLNFNKVKISANIAQICYPFDCSWYTENHFTGQSRDNSYKNNYGDAEF